MKFIFYRLPHKLRLLCEGILVANALQDNWQYLIKFDVLLVGHDNNLGYTYQNQAYAQLLDSLGYFFTMFFCLSPAICVRYI